MSFLAKNNLKGLRGHSKKYLLISVFFFALIGESSAQILERLDSSPLLESTRFADLLEYVGRYRFSEKDFEQDISERLRKSLLRHYKIPYATNYGETYQVVMEKDINHDIWRYQSARSAHLKLQAVGKVEIPLGIFGFCERSIGECIILDPSSLMSLHLSTVYSAKPNKLRKSTNVVGRTELQNVAGACLKPLPCGDKLHLVVLCNGMTMLYFESDKTIQFLLAEKGKDNKGLWSEIFDSTENLFPDFGDHKNGFE